MDFTNIPTGLKITSQIPLDAKQYCLNEDTLSYLGISDNLAYTYYEGLIVYCFQEKTKYEWRQVNPGEENTGLLGLDFTYPNGINVYGVDYSNRSFNFFLTNFVGPTGPQGAQGIQGIQGIQGPRGLDGLDGTNGVDAANNLQKVITSSYTLTDADNNYTILIDNVATPVNITVPTGLMSKINVGFIQQGTADVTFVQSGTVIWSPLSMKKIKGQYFNAYIEQVGNTNAYQLIGNLKA